MKAPTANASSFLFDLEGYSVAPAKAGTYAIKLSRDVGVFKLL